MTIMKILRNSPKVSAAAAAACLALAALGAQATEPMPAREYTCHVIAVDGKNGIAFIQANSEPQALASVVGAMAHVGPTAFAAVASAEQCIPRGEGTLRSGAARKLLASLVL